MSAWLRKLQSRLRALFKKRSLGQEMDDELRFHLEMQTKENIAEGMTPEEAHLAALRSFGGVTQIREICRERWTVRWMESFFRDLRHAVRRLIGEKSFTAAFLAIFALCLGANVAIFSIVNQVLLRPLPFREPGRLVSLYNSYPQAGLERGGTSPLHYIERKERIVAFTNAAAWIASRATIDEGGVSERVDVLSVTPSFFSTLGTTAALGRTFTEEEGLDGRGGVVLLSNEIWREHFNARPTAIGSELRVDGIPLKIIGVMPPRLSYLSQRPQIWTPLSFSAYDLKADQRYRTGMEMIARLRPGATIADVQSQVDALNAHPPQADVLAKTVQAMGFHTVVRNLQTDYVAKLRPILLLLQAGALFLLIIGIVNLANLLLVRGTARNKELRMRQVLGASGFALARSIVVETALLTFLGGLSGLCVAVVLVRGFTAVGADRFLLGPVPELDSTASLAALGASMVLGLILAVPLIWQVLGGDLIASLSVESRSGTPTRGVLRLRHTLIVAQIALAFLMLVGSGLLGLSLLRVLKVQPGFMAENVLTGEVDLAWTNYQEPAQRVALIEKLTDALRALPGVTSVGLTTRLPFSGQDTNDFTPIWIEGRAADPRAPLVYYRGVAGDYFQTLGVPLREGRFLDPEDDEPGKRNGVIDEKVARLYWPPGKAVGHRFCLTPLNPQESDYFTIVGVVGSVIQNDLADRGTYGAVYFSAKAIPPFSYMVAIRTTQSPEAAGSSLRGAISRIDPELPVADLKTMAMRLDDSLTARKTPLYLAGIFAGMALVLAAVGIYGVLAYSVAQRRREIGVRMALGAVPGQILRQFLGLGVRLLAMGLPLGLLGAWLVGRTMAGLLFDVAPADPLVLAGTTGLLAGVTMLACFIPSCRAARVSPSEALRSS